MKAASVQTHPVFGDPEANLARALKLMKTVKADLYVLPELFSTGYIFTSREELAGLAEPLDGPTIQGLKAFSAKTGSMVCAGFAESLEDKIYNSSVLVVQGELEACYRKLHLFKDEKKWFDPGENQPVVKDTPLGCLGLMICFDWIFPEMVRSLALKGAQVLCHPANLVLPYCQQAMVTRSLENSVFTVLANRIGEEQRGGIQLLFTGGSEIIDTRGHLLVKASSDQEEVILADIEVSQADDKMVTPQNHLFLDRRVKYYYLKDWQKS